MYMNKKRKTKTSSAVKAKYNKKTYDTISIRIPKDLAQAFKQKCKEENISQAKIIKNAIQKFIDS